MRLETRREASRQLRRGCSASPGARKRLRTLLCGVKCRGGLHCAEEFSGDVALEAAADLGVGLAFGAAAGDVGVGAGADAPAGQQDVVEGAVELAVSAAVEGGGGDSSGGGRGGAGGRPGGGRGGRW